MGRGAGWGRRLGSFVFAICLLVSTTACATPPAPAPIAAPSPVPPTAAPSPTEIVSTEIAVATATTAMTPPAETATEASTATPPLSPSPSAIAIPPTSLAAVGVMIDNDPRARPQSGLNAADVIYEVVAEFDLTRFLAIYFANAPTMVGSIRSTRPYFAMAMTEYGGGLVHCLDVPGVTNLLSLGSIFDYDLCRGSGDEAAVRTTNRVAPFKLYVDARQLADELNKHPVRSAPALLRRVPLANGGTSVTHVEIAHPDPHVPAWDWNGSAYLRQQDSHPHLDESGAQISTDVIVVQRAEEQPTRYFGEAGYHFVSLIGSGDGTVFAGGSAPVRWSRAAVTSPTVLIDSLGVPFFLPPGRVFIEIVPPAAKITSTG